MLRLTAKLLVDARAELGEGLQLFADGTMTWVDIPNGKVNELDRGQSREVHRFDHPVSKVLPWVHGYLVFGKEEVVGFNDLRQEILRVKLNSYDGNLRCSDGTVLPDGTVLIGLVEMNLEPNLGSLVRIERDWSIHTVVEGASIPNGTALAARGSSFFWTDSPTHQIREFDFDQSSGDISESRIWAELDPELGVPDGICSDTDGGCWIALWGGGSVIRINPSGRIDCQVDVGSRNVTSCAFDQDHNLIITTARATLEEDERDLRGAGGIWMVPSSQHRRQGLIPIRAKLAIPNSSAKEN